MHLYPSGQITTRFRWSKYSWRPSDPYNAKDAEEVSGTFVMSAPKVEKAKDLRLETRERAGEVAPLARQTSYLAAAAGNVGDASASESSKITAIRQNPQSWRSASARKGFGDERSR